MALIRYYTREAGGVRNLERELASLCRKAAKIIAADSPRKVKITVRNLKKIFRCAPRYRYGVSIKKFGGGGSDRIGVDRSWWRFIKCRGGSFTG